MYAIPLLLLALGPQLDPFTGSTITPAERTVLPAGRFLGEVGDLWLVELVSMQNGDGAMALFDPLYLSSHGRSWTLTSHTLNGLSLDDPARSGTPMFELPYHAWDELTYRSLWTDQPGFAARVASRAPQSVWARASGGRDLGGGTWVPAGLMDREPAVSSGPRAERRALTDVRELEASGGAEGGAGSFRLFVEALAHEHRYPTLVDAQTGTRLTDRAERVTVLGVGRLDVTPWPVELLVGWQRRGRNHEGAQFRWPAAYTLATQAEAGIAQASTRLERRAYVLELALGATLRRDDDRLIDDEPLVSDLEGEWMWMLRPRFGERTTRARGEARATLLLPSLPLTLGLRASRAALATRTTIPGLVTAATYERAPTGDVSASITRWEQPGNAREWQNAVRLGAEGDARFGQARLSYALALDHAAVGTPHRRGAAFVTPAAGVGVRAPLGGGVWFTLLRREPDALTSQVSAFLDEARPSGTTYTWEDDGDGRPEASEAGALLSRTGGAYHYSAAGLVRPTSNQLVFGWRTPRFGVFEATLTGVTRWHLDPFTVRLAGDAAQSYVPVVHRDPGGDGRGEERDVGGGQLLTLYERTPGTEGSEIYVLANGSRDNRYIGTELQLASVDQERWFLRLGAAGYWNIGSGGGFGSFPDRNDPGVVHESVAQPNARVSHRGRFDQDRSFAVKLMAGVRPVEPFTAALSLRYRDGQPFTRIWVAQLPQGPTPIMAVWRGGPRHTFHMVLDVRLRYALELHGVSGAVGLDVYNLLGSGTELLEDPRTGPEFRESVEMVPGRAGLLTLELGI